MSSTSIKRATATVIAAMLCLAGCAGSTAGVHAPATFTVLYNDVERAPFRSDWLILDEYQRRQNVTLDVTLGDDGEFNDVIRRTMESGSIPDIVLKCWPETIEPYAYQGLLLPISDYVDLMPHFQDYIAANELEDELDDLRLEDGQYYILPGYQRDMQVQQWIYRSDLFAKHNLDIPGTYDDLFASLSTLKELYPESTPITASWGGAHLFAMMGAGYDISAGWNGTRHYDADQDRWFYSPASDNYREMLRFLNRCFEAGLLDPAIFTQSNDAFIEKICDGHAMVTVTWITSGFGSWNTRLAEGGSPDGEWKPLPVPASTVGLRALPAVNTFRKGLVLPSRIANESYLERILSFVDWAVYSDEGRILSVWGVEGTTFEMTDGGREFLPHIATPKNPDGDVDMSAEYGLNLMFNLAEDTEYEDYKKPDEIVAFLNESQTRGDTLPMNPRLELDDASSDAIRIIDEKLQPYVDDSLQEFITGERSVEEDWQDYVTEIDRLGYPTLEQIWNAAWEQQGGGS